MPSSLLGMHDWMLWSKFFCLLISFLEGVSISVSVCLFISLRHHQGSITLNCPVCQIWLIEPKFDFNLRRDQKKISFESCNCESVEEKILLLVISWKPMKKIWAVEDFNLGYWAIAIIHQWTGFKWVLSVRKWKLNFNFHIIMGMAPHTVTPKSLSLCLFRILNIVSMCDSYHTIAISIEGFFQKSNYLLQ